MLDSKSTTGRHSIQPANNLIRRSFPALQLEVGEDEADLLLQIDHWLTFEGNHGWIKTSAATIQERAFPTWSERKISGVINRMAERGLIYLACQVWPVHDQSPMIALNYETLETLVSITLTYPAEIARTPQELRPTPQKLRGTPQKLRGETLYIYKNLSLNNRKLKEREIEPDEPRSDPKEGEPENLSPSFAAFALALANICSLDYDLNRDKIQAEALVIWEGGYHDPEDLFDVKAWWIAHDWRGQKNPNSPPHLKQIKTVIRQALDHESTQIRRAARNQGLDPDDQTHQRYLKYNSDEFFADLFGVEIDDND